MKNKILKILSRVPEITIYFWIIKVLATTVGETAADFLSQTLNFGIAITSYIMSALLVIALIFQFRAKKYIPSIYWTVVVLISIVGTLITDRMVDEFGISLVTTTSIFSILLSLTFIFWYTREKTLSIHSIFTVKREIFYWLAILFTFSLGTASGDLMAEKFAVGYFPSALIIAGVIALITVSFYYIKLNAILAFWLAYILTRPLGSSIGDWLSQPIQYGGLGYGTVITSFIFLSLILIFVTYLGILERKQSILK